MTVQSISFGEVRNVCSMTDDPTMHDRPVAVERRSGIDRRTGMYRMIHHTIHAMSLSTGDLVCALCGRLVTYRKGRMVHTATVVW